MHIPSHVTAHVSKLAFVGVIDFNAIKQKEEKKRKEKKRCGHSKRPQLQLTSSELVLDRKYITTT
jgi:hypothetical protein